MVTDKDDNVLCLSFDYPSITASFSGVRPQQIDRMVPFVRWCAAHCSGALSRQRRCQRSQDAPCTSASLGYPWLVRFSARSGQHCVRLTGGRIVRVSGVVEHCSSLVVCGSVLRRAFTCHALNVEVSSARHRRTTHCGGGVIQSGERYPTFVPVFVCGPGHDVAHCTKTTDSVADPLCALQTNA
jgi:hypothetical protein